MGAGTPAGRGSSPTPPTFKSPGPEPVPVYEVILFPTDGSEYAAAALEHAIDQADRHDATLDVLYAKGGPDENGEETVEAAADRASEAGVATNTAVLDGEPHEVILNYVEDRGVDLVVMGSHGRRGLDRILVGSVTESVLRSVDVPVLVVPTADG